MLQIKTKVGERGQIVIPKHIRESLSIETNKTIILEVEEKTIRIIPRESKEILRDWKDIAKKEGVNVSKEFIYGDELYEESFSR